MSEQKSLRDSIRAEIRAEMARQNMSQRKLAKELDWPITTVNRRIQGHGPLDIEHLLAISTTLHVTVVDLGFPVLTMSGRRSR